MNRLLASATATLAVLALTVASFRAPDPVPLPDAGSPVTLGSDDAKPLPGYLEGLRAMATELGFLLVFDEIKTGFRHALDGYAGLSGVRPDLAVYGKALASGSWAKSAPRRSSSGPSSDSAGSALTVSLFGKA